MNVSRGVRCLYMMVALIALAQGAAAQPAQPPSAPSAPSAPPPASQGSQQEQRSDTAIVISQKHYIRQGHVEIHDAGQKTDIYADMVEFFEDEDRAVATGNVVVAQGANRISSERADFNTKTTLGTFFNASGIATVPPPKPQPSRLNKQQVEQLLKALQQRENDLQNKLNQNKVHTPNQPDKDW